MKKILGLDLGSTSIGWAYVLEAEKEHEVSSIVRMGVRVVPLTTDETKNYTEGKRITTNAERRQKRMMRRNLDRYQLRRDQLIQLFLQEGWIREAEELVEDGKYPLHIQYKIRAKAVHERVSLRDLARILLMINKKRGYKSNRKTKTAEEDGEALDDMQLALYLKENNMSPGQYAYECLLRGERSLPGFYRSDLQEEFDKIWEVQKAFYSEYLTDELYKNLQGKGKQNATKELKKALGTDTAKLTGKDKRIQLYQWRSDALKKQLPLDQLGLVLATIAGEINASSGYLGAISDRSKILHTQGMTVGEYQYRQLCEDAHAPLKNQIFYRQDYMDEFDKIWDKQASFYPDKLNDELKDKIRNRIIFYQRPLKSQKGLLSFCTFEGKEVEKEVNGELKKVKIGPRVAPRSSPLFQQFKIWQILQNIVITDTDTGEQFELGQDEKEKLFEELNTTDKWSAGTLLKKLYGKSAGRYKINFKEIEGNRTQDAFFKAYQKMMKSVDRTVNLAKANTADKKKLVADFFEEYGITTDILDFDAEAEGKAFIKQPFYQLWHLLYSYEGDGSRSGIQKLLEQLEEKFGFPKNFGRILANISFPDDYASLSTKALKKIYPHIRKHRYEEACKKAGYDHAKVMTKGENEERVLENRLEILPKNSLRNPVVEKILNQMIHVVNAILEHPDMGRPDEIRIELARELKSSAKERGEMTKGIANATKENEKIRELLRNKPFNILNPTRNDIIRYKLWEELAYLGHKTLYSNSYIPKEKLFSKEIDIEHIIPKARLYDDSFSNKTLEYAKVNKDKGDDTAMSYVLRKYGEEGAELYRKKLKDLHENKKISTSKYFKLLKTNEQLEKMQPFIERDLRETQYIAKKAKDILLQIARHVVPTTGKITDILRQDWGLIDVLKEINLPKYRALGLTKVVENRHGRKKEIILNWTKRNDHRHHAMDALVVAFTTHNHINYLNQVNAGTEKNKQTYALEKLLMYKDGSKKKFKSPMPNFRQEAKKHLEAVLVSRKAKNKVTTRNINKIKRKGGYHIQQTLSPRGQLHKETVYGVAHRYVSKEEKIGSAFDKEKIMTVANKRYRDLLLHRLDEFGGDPKKAFTGKNSLEKNPIYLPNGKPLPGKVKTVVLERFFTTRKEVGPDLNVSKVVDPKIRKLLQERLAEYGGNAKEAFAQLEKNPIWLNKEAKIQVKRVTIRGVDKAQPLHEARNHKGQVLADENREPIPVDYVQTGNNHHVAIYRDPEGRLHERVVSFFEAVQRQLQGLPIVDKDYQSEKGWEFLFSLKQNEYFLFPSEKDDFDPREMDLLKPENAPLISPHLFRVQKISAREYLFTHHLETEATTGEHLKNFKNLRGIKYHRLQTPDKLKGLVKIRLNHLGEIVQVGEY